jgi:hypothetical protein
VVQERRHESFKIRFVSAVGSDRRPANCRFGSTHDGLFVQVPFIVARIEETSIGGIVRDGPAYGGGSGCKDGCNHLSAAVATAPWLLKWLVADSFPKTAHRRLPVIVGL